MPLRNLLLQELVQGQRFTKVHITASEVTQLAENANHLPEVLFLLTAALELLEVSIHFHHMLITQVDGNKGQRTVDTAQLGLQRHGDHAGLWLQQTAGT